MTGQTGVGFQEHSLLLSPAECLVGHWAEPDVGRRWSPLHSLVPGQWEEEALRMAVLRASLDLLQGREQPPRTRRNNQPTGGPGMCSGRGLREEKNQSLI